MSEGDEAVLRMLIESPDKLTGGCVAAHSFMLSAIDEEHLQLKYRARILEIGPMVSDFFPHGILIFFGEAAPEELREVALVHDGVSLASEIVAGDLLKFTPVTSDAGPPSWYRLTAVGDMANANLADLGHFVIHFDGLRVASLPGAVSAEPSLISIPTVGATFELFGLEEK